MTNTTPSSVGDHGRSHMVDALRAELFGPEPLGDPLDISTKPVFQTWKDSNGPWHDRETGEEILTRDGPFKRYGVGVLYPLETVAVDVSAESSDDENGLIPPNDSGAESNDDRSVGVVDTLGRGGGTADSDDFDLTAANKLKPSAMAISFLISLDEGSGFSVVADCGRYEQFGVVIEGAERSWWVRRKVTLEATWLAPSILDPGVPHAQDAEFTSGFGLDSIEASFEVYTRPRSDGSALVTVALVNRSQDGGSGAASLYQVGFSVHTIGDARILPYPDHRSTELLEQDQEERSLRLLYRKSPTFAIGHGCAATWSSSEDELIVEEVDATALPSVETPSITPEIQLRDGTELSVSMASLAGMTADEAGMTACGQVVVLYEEWIRERRVELDNLSGTDRVAGIEHMVACETMVDRMREGLTWLSEDPIANRAFKLANRAILEQQLRSASPMRTTTITKQGGIKIEGEYPSPDWATSKDRGKWRPFQIGFILSAARSTVITGDDYRSEVELIFFPTGGGKTEAYLGLAAFALFYQRLVENEHPGVGVLMRYTLRLLTAQQFLRASALICAMELIRQADTELGEVPFTIGIWVGQSATPNRRTDARSKLRSLNRTPGEKNPFLILQCPWCGAGMGPASAGGPVRRESGAAYSIPRTAGYIEREGSVRFRCPDNDCEFSSPRSGLPVYVVDEDVYEKTPSIVIGTVDKFARVAWTPDARNLFGIQPDGSRGWAPPNLIIQDELHLISGPLGSMAGLYETLIEDLCTDHRSDPPRVPKIVCSTATIRQFRKQVKHLYNRERASLFPPFGLDASDSFFARYARDAAGDLLPGREYMGVYAPGLGSGQTTLVRTMSALLQGAKELEQVQADPWWTLMCFFNSLRELGISVSLTQSDIPDYLKVMRNRRGTPPDQLRYLNEIKELTARLRDDEVPRAIQELSRTTSDSWPVDVCLASSMIEVGIDIPRLSLMCVVGQPKSTSQYIQVTGRIGREWRKKPGLVVTIYGASKPRDRSHFERFTTYHNQLYAQVEPVSVTPFAPPVVRRAAHAVMCGYVRQYGPDTLSPWPMPEELLESAKALLEERVQSVDSEEYPMLKELIEQRLYEWRSWERQDWDAKPSSGIDPAPLLRAPGRWYPDQVKRVSWPTPNSLRDVDAECEGKITLHYAIPPEGS